MDTFKIFEFATSFVTNAPEYLGRTVFHGVGTIAGVLPLGGVAQLRENYQRISPVSPWRSAVRGIRGMQHYMRYYYEIFRQSEVTVNQLPYRTWVTDDTFMRSQFDQGKPVIAALMHTGNWDLAGAWSEKHFAHVVTVAEKLADPRMAEHFLNFRQDLGMTIYQAVKGGHTFHELRGHARHPVLIPLLADRDLTATGVTVSLAGHDMMVAPGPALLAIATGEPIVPLMMAHRRLSGEHAKRAGTTWGNEITSFDPIYPAVDADSSDADKRAEVQRLCQAWMDAVQPWLEANIEHWHMLQKVFVADLDQDRLRRARENA